MFGDGAANQGTFGETLNLAALWKLPVVFMVTNNQFGMGTSLERHTAQTDLHKRGEGFGVPGLRCDGMDVVDTYEVISEAIEQVRDERAPMLVEASPTASAATRWPTPRSTAPRSRSRSGASATRSRSSPTKLEPGVRGPRGARRGARSSGSTRRSSSPRLDFPPRRCTTTCTCSATR